jgi:benzoyl-CoA reductase subunit C
MEFESIVEKCKEIIEDPFYRTVAEWKNQTGGKAVGYFPVYTPVEVIHAGGLLPVGITGAGNKLEIAHADARFGSFICSIVKSTMELGLRGHLNVLDGMVFHSICDSARNLAFLFKRNFSPAMFVEYIHLPQNPDSEAAVEYLVSELDRVKRDFETMTDRSIGDDDLARSIRVYNENRSLIRRLYQVRRGMPHLLSTPELYALVKVGHYLPPEEHSAILFQSLRALAEREVKPRDKIRVVLEGSFCEQPPLELLEILDDAGCYIVDDDLVIGRRWFAEDVPENGQPLRSLAESYLKRSVYSSVRHDWRHRRFEGLLEKVKYSEAEAVIFCIAKFCEPAFFDYVLFKDALEKENIPHLLLEFEEKMWTFEKARTEVETFVESILFD